MTPAETRDRYLERLQQKLVGRKIIRHTVNAWVKDIAIPTCEFLEIPMTKIEIRHRDGSAAYDWKKKIVLSRTHLARGKYAMVGIIVHELCHLAMSPLIVKMRKAARRSLSPHCNGFKRCETLALATWGMFPRKYLRAYNCELVSLKTGRRLWFDYDRWCRANYHSCEKSEQRDRKDSSFRKLLASQMH